MGFGKCKNLQEIYEHMEEWSQIWLGNESILFQKLTNHCHISYKVSEKLCHFRNIVLNRWEGGVVSKILVGQNENLSSFPSTQVKAELISPCLSLQLRKSRARAP